MILRMVRKLAFAAGVMTAVLSGGTAYATIIWDYSPAYTHKTITGDFENSATNYFAEVISFATGATVTGIDIYSGSTLVSFEQSAIVRLWSDGDGAPGDLLEKITTSITAVDTDGAIGELTRKHADVAPLLLAAGTRYWIGMSGGNDSDLGQAGLEAGIKAVEDGYMASFVGNDDIAFFGLVLDGDMAFRLEGTINAVPEPGTFLLLGAGLGGLVLYRRKRRA